MWSEGRNGQIDANTSGIGTRDGLYSGTLFNQPKELSKVGAVLTSEIILRFTMSEQARVEALKAFNQILPSSVSPGEATEAYNGVDNIAYNISRLPLGAPRALKVICVGAGFSGLAFAREVERGHLPNVSLTVYEKNASVGGTWYENRYPGYVRLLPTC